MFQSPELRKSLRRQAPEAGFPNDDIRIFQPVYRGGERQTSNSGEARQDGSDEEGHRGHKRQENLLELPERPLPFRTQVPVRARFRSTEIQRSGRRGKGPRGERIGTQDRQKKVETPRADAGADSRQESHEDVPPATKPTVMLDRALN